MRSDCNACSLRGAMICAEVSVEQLGELHTCIEDLTIRPGQSIFQADAPSAAVFCICAGFVKLVKYSSHSQRIVCIVQAGGVAGMEALFSPTFKHTAIAMGEVLACRMPAASFRHMVETNPSLQRRLFQYAHQAMLEAETWLSELAGGHAQTRERMARLLLRLRDGGTDRIHRFGLADIAEMLGTTVETVSRIHSEFIRVGLLTKSKSAAPNRCYSADIAGLERVADALDIDRGVPGRIVPFKK